MLGSFPRFPINIILFSTAQNPFDVILVAPTLPQRPDAPTQTYLTRFDNFLFLYRRRNIFHFLSRYFSRYLLCFLFLAHGCLLLLFFWARASGCGSGRCCCRSFPFLLHSLSIASDD